MPRKREDSPVVVQPKPTAIQPPTIAFDAWWAMNEKRIPVQHRKEIIKADFRARGLSMKETANTYNDALKVYGVKLK